MTGAVILGCSGPALTADEAALYREAAPWGFILFRRNMVDQEQLLAFSDKVKFILRAQERSESRAAAPHQATA